jgi:RTX calcium-binding nonapeptide repeat (4 copies)
MRDLPVHPTRRPVLAAGAAAAMAFGLAGALAGTPAGAAPNVSARVKHDTLFVTAGSGAQDVVLRVAAGDVNSLEVDFNDDGAADARFDRATFSTIKVSLGSGNDAYREDGANGAVDEPTTVDGGSGRDTLDGGAGVEQLLGSSGNDLLDGNQGNDTGVLGSGNDVFRWDPGDGSDVVEGSSGTDTLDFNGAGAAENMSLSANGRRSIFFRDVGNITMDMDDVERLDLTALGGADQVTVNDMSGTDFRRADVDLSVNGAGDGVADLVTVNGTERADRVDVEADGSRVEVEGLRTTTRITGSETIDRLLVDTRGGNDDVDVDADVSALIDVDVELGSGQ